MWAKRSAILTNITTKQSSTKMIVNFTKMHGLGNDFVVIDLITQSARLNATHIKRIADRKFGVGCDQVILVTPPTRAEADFFYRIYNADGQEVEQCGNGVRCAAKFFVTNNLSQKNKLVADCLGGTMLLHIEDDQQVSVDLGNNYSSVIKHPLNYAGLPNEIYAISVGNPHGVCLVSDTNNRTVYECGKKLTNDSIFPHGANISCMQIINPQHINLRVYERGVGPTLACGSAACAAVLVGQSIKLLDDEVTVSFEYGDLTIATNPKNKNIRMTGPASGIFMGRFRI